MAIDYSAREPGAARRVHFVTCGFGGTTFERERLDLVAVETDEGNLGAARLLYLKRFWLSKAEREGAVTAPPPRLRSLNARVRRRASLFDALRRTVQRFG